MDRQVCPECGARLAKGVERCDLCGATQEWERPTTADSASDGPTPDSATRRDANAASESPQNRGESPPLGTGRRAGIATFCNGCGWENPPGSKFCSQCGARLQVAGLKDRREASRSPAPSLPPKVWTTSAAESDQDGSLGRHVAVLVGLAVLVVVALFMITVMSKQRPTAPPDASVAAPAATRAASVIQEHEAIPIAERYQGRVDSLRTIINSENEAQSLEARHQLVEFFIGIGRIDRAAIEQMRLADGTQDPGDWKISGNLLSDWMEMSEPDSKAQIALLAIDAFKRVLEQQPDDLETRADLGWVYQYDPQNPMEAIRQTNLVLEADADHLMANYNKGVFLVRINRLDQALEQFERVKTLAATDSPYYRQADMWIVTIRESQAERGAG